MGYNLINMKVILKQDVRGVGRKGDVKDVNEGYANNFLLPKKLAEFASKENVARFEKEKKHKLAEEEKQKKEIAEKFKILESQTVFLKKKANEKGHLFEKIKAEEVVAFINKNFGIDIKPDFLKMENPIKEIGETEISLEMMEVKGKIRVRVEAL